jgi:hypothetical protein
MMGAAIDHFGGPQRSPVLSKEVLTLIPHGSNGAVAPMTACGTVVGWYLTHEGKPGLVIQQDGTQIVHVYREGRVGSEEAR